jgi:hypothetical protein
VSSVGSRRRTKEMSTEELIQQLAEKDKTIIDLKEKTKSYILKMQGQHQEALQALQETSKESQVSTHPRESCF